jgi:alkanesulfonate monooxygenase SsuD/methylene tetrahydromethanopterin reductase-like flavin-dependent oxidoreductase (luciferase family)
MAWETLDDATRELVAGRMVLGGPDELVGELQELLALGLDGLVVNLPINGQDPEMVAVAGQAVTKALG